MRNSYSITSTHIASCFLLFFTSNTFADGLSDLKQVLSSVNASSLVDAEFTYETSNIRHDGDDTIEQTGKVSIAVLSDNTGLQMQYSDEVMAKLDAETQLRASDEDADTPTLWALNSIDAVDINRTLNVKSSLERRLQHATFVNEEIVEKEGQTLRKLNFTLPLEQLITDKQTRKYVKKFSNAYEIIIDDDGVPLESHLTFEGKGRAFIFFSAEVAGESNSSYVLHNGRLVRTYLDNFNRWDSTFGNGHQADKEWLTLNEK